MARLRLLVLAVGSLVCGLGGCGDDEPTETAGSGGTGGAGGAGGSAELCSDDQAPTAEGTCSPAGAAECAEGFESDDLGGCAPVLPAMPCADGEVALLGETSCHPIMDCGAAPWGDIPTEATTQYVDASYAGGASDGSAAAPWTTVSEAVDAVALGGSIAIAEGTYTQPTLYVSGQIRLFGRCPSLVHLVAAEVDKPAIQIDGTGGEIHGVSVSGGSGILIGAIDAWIDQVWIVDTKTLGMAVIDPVGPAFARVTSTLFERTTQAGLIVAGSSVELEDVWIRDVQPSLIKQAGLAIGLLPGPESGNAASLVMRSSVIERVRSAGIVADGGDLLIERSVVRDVDPQEQDDDDGQGIGYALYDADTPGTVTVSDSVVARTHEAGILVAGGIADISRTTITSVEGAPGGNVEPAGIAVQPSLDGVHLSSLVVHDTTIRETGVAGLLAVDASVEAERIRVSDNTGDGVLLLTLTSPTTATLSGSLITRAGRAGVSSFGATVSLAHNQISCNPIDINGETWAELPATFQDQGGNLCGCDDVLACTVQAANLQPPSALQ